MSAQLYELQIGTSLPSTGRRRSGHPGPGHNNQQRQHGNGWARCTDEDESTPSRHKAAKRIPRMRWHLLMKIRKLMKKGEILLDVDQTTFAGTVFRGLEHKVSTVNAHDTLQRQISNLAQHVQVVSRDSSTNSLAPIVTTEVKLPIPPEKKIVANYKPHSWLRFLCRRTEKKSKDWEENEEVLLNGAKVFIVVVPMEHETKPTMIFVRFDEEVQFFALDDSAPTKYAAVLAGPPHCVKYGELGRCLCDLLSNPMFQRILSRAETPEALLAGLDRIMDHAIVIAPGQLNQVTELNIHRFRRALMLEPPRKHGHQNGYHGSDLHSHTHSHPPHDSPLIHYDPLLRTGKLFNGFMADIRNRYRHYASDFRDAYHYKCVVSTILIFFITFATAIGLGEILRSKTEGLMGLSETLVSMCVCGVIWGLFSGQPLIIQTKTAAFVIIEGGLFTFCYTHNLNFMIVRVWTGVWALPITILMVAFEAPVLIRYVTRFTEEMIDTLISVVLIFESISFLADTFNDNPLLDGKEYCLLNSSVEEGLNMDSQSLYGVTSAVTEIEDENSQGNVTVEHIQDFIGELHNQPNTALLTLVLMISTFFLSLYLERLKESSYFSHTVRKAIGNFSIPITIPLTTLAANFLFSASYVHKLDMPCQFSPTRPYLRGWFVNPFDSHLDPPFPLWAIFASILPAFLLTILLFVELELAEHELSLKERGLRKGSGFHMDLVLSGFLVFICGLFGIPWLGAGCVESFSHANALTINKKGTIDDDIHKIDRVVEQRVTTILVALLQGACTFLGTYLRRIPVSVLMGIFVHLSLTNLTLLEFVHRMILYIVPRKYYPDKSYCQKVSTWKMHLFTTIQLICFAVLFGVEVVGKISILFPLVVGIIALVRHTLLSHLFTIEELHVLDSEGDLDNDEVPNDGTMRRKSLSP